MYVSHTGQDDDSGYLGKPLDTHIQQKTEKQTGV